MCRGSFAPYTRPRYSVSSLSSVGLLHSRSALNFLLRAFSSVLLRFCFYFLPHTFPKKEVADMLMSAIWLGMVALALLYGSTTGNTAAVSEAVFGGAQAAVELCISITGALCLWSALIELMTQSGLGESLSKLLRPFLKRIFPLSFQNEECAAAISTNFTANLLGLGNAATPAGLKAVDGMLRLPDRGSAENEICRLVVMNSASLQLIPATLAAIRSSLGAADSFDILPCVWLTSIVSVSVGLVSARLMEGMSR